MSNSTIATARRRSRLTLLAMVLLAVAGCRATPAATVTPATPTTAATAAATLAATRTVTAVPTATTTPAPTPTAPRARIELNAQPVDADGAIAIARVVAIESGWIALTSDDRLLATAPVSAGITDDLLLTVDPLAVGEQIVVTLYAGAARAFDPDALTPVLDADAQPVRAVADVTLQVGLPDIAATDQALGADGVLTVARVVTPQDGWLRVYNDADGAPGEAVGLLFVPAGALENLRVALDWRHATPRLHVALHADLARPGRFDADGDPLLVVRGEPLAVAVQAVYPPDVYVIDQPVLNNQVVIERVISYGPGWLAVRVQGEDERPGNIIGFAPLADGVNVRVVVDLVPLAATPVLYAQLHTDSGAVGTFEYPAADPVVAFNGEMFTFAFATDRGNYVVSADQSIALEGGAPSVVVPYAIGDLAMWVTVRADRDGRIGDVLGYTWVAPGINRNVRVELTGGEVTPLLHAVLHVDVDQPQVFEFPDGRDFELQRRRAPIDAPFRVLSP